MPRIVKIYSWDYGDMGQDYDYDIWYPKEFTEYPEPKRDTEAEQAEWLRKLEETEGQPDIPL